MLALTHVILMLVEGLLTVRRMALGADIANGKNIYSAKWRHLECAAGTNQYVPTSLKITIWDTDLTHWLPALEFEPRGQSMAIYPTPVHGRFWTRGDVEIVNSGGGDCVIAVSRHGCCRGRRLSCEVLQGDTRMCGEGSCLEGNLWYFDEGPWRLCTLCNDGRGEWYHVRCLGPSLDAGEVLRRGQGRDPMDGGVPHWIGASPRWSAGNPNEEYWQNILSLPVQRGYVELGEPGTFSFEGVLMAVRDTEGTPADARGQVMELVARNTWRPADGLEDGFVTLGRVNHALRLLQRWSDHKDAHRYYQCSKGHMC